MKKLLILTAIAAIALVSCRDNKPIAYKDLPTSVQNFVQDHLAEKSFTYATLDQDLLNKEYTLYFSDGTVAEIDIKGNWTKIESNTNPIPEGIIPESLLNTVNQYYENAIITAVERDSRRYEVKLSNGIEMTFDKEFNLMEVDD